MDIFKVTEQNTTNEISDIIENRFKDGTPLTLLTDGPKQYNTALKAACRARQHLVPLGIDLAAETFFQSNEGRYAEREALKLVLTNVP